MHSVAARLGWWEVNAHLPEAALLLIGHGSARHPAAAAPTYQHAAELRRRGNFAQVREAFWKQEPGIRAVLAEIREPKIFIVPLFISNGYFTEEVIPRELGLPAEMAGFPKIQRRGDQRLYYSAAVGTHPSMSEVVLARAREVTEHHPFPRSPKPQETALFVAGHGTDRNENSRRAIDEQVERIRARNCYAEVHAVFMEEKPAIAHCYEMTPLRNLIVVPFLMSEGLHASQDIPVLLGEPERVVLARLAQGQPTWRNPTERNGKRVWYGRSVGSASRLADVVLERVREMVEDTPSVVSP